MKGFFKYCFLLIVLFLSSCFSSDSNIKKIYSISEAEQELLSANEETLVAFDIDNTLLDPNEKLSQIEYLKSKYFDDPKFVKRIRHDFKELFIKNGKKFRDDFISKIYLNTTFKPVEDKTLEIVKNLIRRGVKVIVLTASYTGKFGKIKNMQELRFKNLLDSGFDFRKSFETKEVVLDKLKSRDGYYPMFYKGLLFSATSSKGKVLGAFFDAIKWKPKKVIFFDELIKNNRSVVQEMKKRKIDVTSFQYMAAFKEKIKLGNKKLIEYQYNYLVEYGQFLNNEEALDKMNIDQSKPVNAQFSYAKT